MELLDKITRTHQIKAPLYRKRKRKTNYCTVPQIAGFHAIAGV